MPGDWSTSGVTPKAEMPHCRRQLLANAAIAASRVAVSERPPPRRCDRYPGESGLRSARRASGLCGRQPGAEAKDGKDCKDQPKCAEHVPKLPTDRRKRIIFSYFAGVPDFPWSGLTV